MSERDIVERLDQLYSDGFHGKETSELTTLRSAAAEILRLRAELAAQAVPDEEVAQAVPDEEVAQVMADCIYGPISTGIAVMQIRSLRAAGFTVIHTEARDGGE